MRGSSESDASRRERMVVVDPRGTGMVLITLRAAEEVRVPQFTKSDGTIDAEMLAIARAIIGQRTGKFDPSRFRDRYQESRVHRWLLDPGSIDKPTAARLADPSIQQRRVARAAEIGKRWPELPVARKRPVLTTLIERIAVRAERIDIRLR